MKKPVLFSCALAALLLAPAHASAAPRPEQLRADVDHILGDAAAHGFGGALVIRHEGRILLARGYGLADREKKTAFTPRTIAQIGSITKTFTAAAILQLVQAGKVRLDAKVRAYLSDAPQPAADLTVAQLLTHRAGLMDSCGEDFSPVSKRDLLRSCMAKPLLYPVGEFHYSNVGYSILAALVEAASGMRWEDYIAAHILRPLRMSDAGYAFAAADRRPFASGYLMDRAAPPISVSIAKLNGRDWNLKGNGGMQASALDMDRFVNALAIEDKSPLAPLRPLMLVPGPRSADGKTAEGYGLVFRFGSDGRVWRLGGSGSDGTFFSYMIYYPRTRSAIYFVGNNGEHEVRTALAKVMEAMDRDLELAA